MREYIILVAMASIISALVDILSPENWRKYIRIVTGFLILAVLISPVAKFKNIEIFDAQESFQASEIPARDMVAEELQKRVERDIEERILVEFKREATAIAELDIDSEHRIRGVKRIRLSLKKAPDGLRERLLEVYGCENIEFGTDKNY